MFIQPRPSGEKIAAIAEKLDLKKNVVRVSIWATQWCIYCSFIFDKLQKILNEYFGIFLKLSLCAGLVLQPASEAEEDEVCGPRQHPLAAALLPRHKKSKFSIPGTTIRGRTGNTFEKRLKLRPTSKKHPSNWEIESWKKSLTSFFWLFLQPMITGSEPQQKTPLVENQNGHFKAKQFPFVVAIGNC